jgi:ketosteroid isomerase-like protein
MNAQAQENRVTTESQKQRAMEFLKEFERPDPARLAAFITEDFEYELMARMPGVKTHFNREEAMRDFVGMLKVIVPNGFNFGYGVAISDGPHVVVEAESRTTTSSGRPYNNRYLFFFRFDGDKIARMREYCDTNHVREVFMT